MSLINETIESEHVTFYLPGMNSKPKDFVLTKELLEAAGMPEVKPFPYDYSELKYFDVLDYALYCAFRQVTNNKPTHIVSESSSYNLALILAYYATHHVNDTGENELCVHSEYRTGPNIYDDYEFLNIRSLTVISPELIPISKIIHRKLSSRAQYYMNQGNKVEVPTLIVNSEKLPDFNRIKAATYLTVASSMPNPLLSKEGDALAHDISKFVRERHS